MWRLKAWLAGAVAGILALLAVWGAGKRAARQEAAQEALRGYRETRERIDAATDDLGDDPDVLRDWLRERGRER